MRLVSHSFAFTASILQLGSEIQTNPAAAVGLIGLEQSPAGRTRAVCFLHNGEDALSGITARCVVRAGTFADIEVIDTDSHLIRERCRRFRCTSRSRRVHRFPAFMSIFAREYNYNRDSRGFFPEDELLYQFFAFAIERCGNKFVRDWYRLNLDITNILTALLARRQGWNVTEYIKGEGEVQEMIRENKTKDFDLTHEYDYVKELMRIVDEPDPVRKEKMIDAFKWMWLDERTFFNPFSIESVFSYACKLAIQYRWAKLDVEKGKETFAQIIENLRGEARVPEEFAKA